MPRLFVRLKGGEHICVHDKALFRHIGKNGSARVCHLAEFFHSAATLFVQFGAYAFFATWCKTLRRSESRFFGRAVDPTEAERFFDSVDVPESAVIRASPLDDNPAFFFLAMIFRKPASKFASVFDRQNFHEVSVLGNEQFKCSGKNLTIRACETAIRLSYRRVRISLWSSCFSFFRAAFCSAPLHKNQAFRASAFAPFPRCARERLPRHSNPCRKIRQVHSY